MRRMTLQEIAAAMRGRLVFAEGETFVDRVSTDSRTLEPGDLFIALHGDRFDAHDFLDTAARKGAAALVVDRDQGWPQGVPVLAVRDTLTALADLARVYRQSMAAPFVGVTGSCGKTTVKELITCVLEPSLKVVRAPKSFNNAIGVPVTILGAPPDAGAVIVEMGTNAPGEIKTLADTAQPNIGVITNVGPAHLEGLGSIEGVARAKAELLDGLAEGGMAILNADNRWVRKISTWCDCRKVTYGRARDADVRASGITIAPDGSSFKVRKTAFEVPLPGRHNVSNALAAIAVGLRLSIPIEEIASRLASAQLPEMRLDRRRVGDVTFIVDCYNANPMSVKAGLEVLCASDAARHVFVFGGMGELGSASASRHREVGRFAARAGVDVIVAIGEDAALAADAARGVEGRHVAAHVCRDVDEAADVLRQLLACGDHVLFKASRAVRLERLVETVAGPSTHCPV